MLATLVTLVLHRPLRTRAGVSRSHAGGAFGAQMLLGDEPEPGDSDGAVIGKTWVVPGERRLAGAHPRDDVLLRFRAAGIP